jgi:DNA-binding PadR family transcriptional regulator
VGRVHRRSPLALAILSLLKVGPMHPYRMQQLIKQWGKLDVINVEPRGSLYKMIDRLRNAGLIAVAGVDRAGQGPDRTVYQITDEGDLVAGEWLRAMLSEPRRSFPEFPAAVSFLPLLEPAEAIPLLAVRSDRLRSEVARLSSDLATAQAEALPAVAVLDTEYLLAVATAEAQWVDSLLTELRAGRIGWTITGLRALVDLDRG